MTGFAPLVALQRICLNLSNLRLIPSPFDGGGCGWGWTSGSVPPHLNPLPRRGEEVTEIEKRRIEDGFDGCDQRETEHSEIQT